MGIAGLLTAIMCGSGCGDDSQTGESGPPTDCTPGYEGCACTAPPASETAAGPGRCLDGLRCLSELCVLDDGWSSSTSHELTTDSGSGGQAGDASTGEHPGTTGAEETSSTGTTSGTTDASNTTGSSSTDGGADSTSDASTADEGTTASTDDDTTTDESTTNNDEATTNDDDTGNDESTTETTDPGTTGETSNSDDTESTTDDTSDSASDDSELIIGADDELTVWYRRLTTRSDGSPVGVAADRNNNVYILARLPGNNGSTLASYDELGTLRWIQLIEAISSSGDVAVDDQGFLTVGYRSSEGMGIQLRRAEDGSHVWTRTEDLGESSRTNEIAFAHDGSIIAAGHYRNPSRGLLLWSRNYDREGYLVWKNPARRRVESHTARGLAPLPSGGFVLASMFTIDDLPADSRIHAYNAAGQSTWKLELRTQGTDNVTQGSDTVSDITVDADGNLYFTHVSRMDEVNGRVLRLHVASHGLDGKLRWEFNQRFEDINGYPVTATIARSTGDTLVFGAISTRNNDGSTQLHPWARRFGPGGEEGWHADLDPSFSISRAAAGSGTTVYGLGAHTSPDNRVILVRFDAPFGNRLGE